MTMTLVTILFGTVPVRILAIAGLISYLHSSRTTTSVILETLGLDMIMMPIILMTLCGMELGVEKTAPVVNSETLLGCTPHCHRPPQMMWKHASVMEKEAQMRTPLYI